MWAVLWLLRATLLSLAEQSITCMPGRQGHRPGMHHMKVSVSGHDRTFRLYVPPSYKPEARIPLWILAPAKNDDSQILMDQAQIMQTVNVHPFAFAVLHGLEHSLNILPHGQANHSRPDDVVYTRVVLRHITVNLCIDEDRIRCTGFGQGARFCSRLASELSSFLAGVAVVSGLEYPIPNNATRPIPVVAFHGARDPIDPFDGHGKPQIRQISVDDAARQWGVFNGCNSRSIDRSHPNVVITRYEDCVNNADVVLVKLENGGHTWPGSNFIYDTKTVGCTAHEIQATDFSWHFFLQHPRPHVCRTARKGEPCFAVVEREMFRSKGYHVKWQPRFTPASSFEDFQQVINDEIAADCPEPCRGKVVPSWNPVNRGKLQIVAESLNDTRVRATTATAATTMREAAAAAPAESDVATSTKANSRASIEHPGAVLSVASPWMQAAARTAAVAAAKATRNRTNSTTSVPGTTTSRTKATITGNWTHQSDPGKFFEIIQSGAILWDGGLRTQLVMEDNGAFSTQWQDTTYRGRLVGDELQWADGDVWVRAEARGCTTTAGATGPGRPSSLRNQAQWWVLSRLVHRPAVQQQGLNPFVLMGIISLSVVAVLTLRELRRRHTEPPERTLLGSMSDDSSDFD